MNAFEHHYYERNPPPDSQTGDVWSNLPFRGICKTRHGSGLLISPACDLANCKTEVVTFLPIISLQQYFSCPASYMEYRPLLNQCFATGGLNRFSDMVGIENIPSAEDIDSLLQIIRQKKFADPRVGDRIETSLICLKNALDPAAKLNDWVSLRASFGKKMEEQIEEIIRNSKRVDLHFLPTDKEDPEWSAIPHHSVALLRYPVTLPLRLLTASTGSDDHWKRFSQEFEPDLKVEMPRPVKILQLKEQFLSDLITRFVALFSRIGSPDFSESSVERIRTEILK